MPKNEKNEKIDIIDNINQNLDTIVLQFTMEKHREYDEIHLRNTIHRLAERLSMTEQIPIEHATIGICMLMQSGAHLKSVTNRKITIGGKEFTKKSVLYCYEAIECKYTLREIARYLNKTIANLAYKYNVPGNLYARFKIENANLIANSDPETVRKYSTYCADFQIENPDTPPIVREFLSTREKTRTSKK